MRDIVFPENVVNTVQQFLLCNAGDKATEEVILCMGADLLDIPSEEMREMSTMGTEGESVSG